ncbi:Bromodomain-containing protein [Aspergillus cavernicola]|uniref:Bromodomain-containing protein n=1 Tax=Aspergillus cavernicola TaxID=176166 RepID=A0ABR4IZ27_9EURO
MPPLSAYTPLESLLFFQSLAALDTRPASFVSISDLLRSNKFVRDNGAFDAHRLSPESLEDLYTTLMRDGIDSSAPESNGHHPDSASPGNPKKRKITSPRPDGLSDGGRGHVGFVPGLVSHLYAKYKELVTKEIRIEELRFKEIREDIERLQKDEREAPAEKIAELAPTPVSHAKQEPVPEPMDLDTNEKSVEQRQPPRELKPAPVEPVAAVAAKQPELETPHVPSQPAFKEFLPPAQPVERQPEAQKNLQPQVQLQLQPQPQALPPQPLPQQPIPAQEPQIQSQPQPQPQQQPPIRPQQDQVVAPNLAPQPQLPNEKSPVPIQQPGLAPRNAPVQDKTTNVPKTQPQKPLPTPVAVAPVPTPGPPRPPSGTPLHIPQAANVPVPSPTLQKAAPTAKPPGKKGAPVVPVSTAPPRVPPQSSFQQWSLNKTQPPQHPLSFSIPEPAGRVKPPLSPPTQQTPKPEKKAPQGPQPVATPSTPQPTPSAFHTPAPPIPASGFATPIGPVRGFPSIGERGSKPQLSIRTPGSVTPWKQTPHLTLPRSPRSPERPRPEDVSPISEKGASPFRSREVTPEERGLPPRRKGPGRGRKKGTDIDQGGPKKKGEKSTTSTGKKRERSASSRSRGRSILSRDEESELEAGKIKREVPSTPAGIIGSAEPERASTGPGATTSEPRPGRGRPKRKRAISEVPEPEPPQPELSQLSRMDSNQSLPYVVCARNFPRTGAPIMNDVTTHKHASIFTKPLTERDAPGYRDLIYRPQDLKSIKSAIHQGSKALATATEAANTPVVDGESPAPNAGTPSKNAVLMLQKTEDVIPPKAIVTSAQLEKELIRMFSNAVMFNPVPQRGFGPAFPMAADGGSGSRSYAPEPDEGGIIKDTVEMFEDVEQAVTRWRAAERTADELANKSVLSLRRESASDPNMDSADDVKG